MLQLHTIRCKNCNYKRFLDDELLEKFAAIKKVPLETFDAAYLQSLSGQFRCKECQSKDTVVYLSRSCLTCDKPIPLKRLDAAPKTKRCVPCQERYDKGETEPIDYGTCDRCGAPMTLRLRKATPTKYFLGCSTYPKCGFMVTK